MHSAHSDASTPDQAGCLALAQVVQTAQCARGIVLLMAGVHLELGMGMLYVVK